MDNDTFDTRRKYTLYGVSFGLFFPLLAWFLDAHLQDTILNFQSLVTLHVSNPIHFVVDLAPVVLGLAGNILGNNIDKKKVANNHLWKMNQALDTFSHKITHDMRSPAMRVKGFVEVLQWKLADGDLSEQKKVLDMIEQSTDKWLKTFEDFVELLKNEKEGISEKIHCDLSRAVGDVGKELQTEVAEVGAKIDIEFDACRTVYASLFDLKSSIKNLISNSLKYAHPERKSEIYIQSIRHKTEAMIMYQDNGIGIDLEKYGQRVFDLFERANEIPDIPGTGVGLYLVKEQVEKNGGRIEVESTLGEGTTFTNYLPV